MDFENDLDALETAIHEIQQRIQKLEKHKESIDKALEEYPSDKTLIETLRRLDHNLDELNKKHAFLIEEKKSKNTKI